MYKHADSLAKKVTSEDVELDGAGDAGLADALQRIEELQTGLVDGSDSSGSDNEECTVLPDTLRGREAIELAQLCRGEHVKGTAMDLAMKEKAHNLWRLVVLFE